VHCGGNGSLCAGLIVLGRSSSAIVRSGLFTRGMIATCKSVVTSAICSAPARCSAAACPRATRQSSSASRNSPPPATRPQSARTARRQCRGSFRRGYRALAVAAAAPPSSSSHCPTFMAPRMPTATASSGSATMTRPTTATPTAAAATGWLWAHFPACIRMLSLSCCVGAGELVTIGGGAGTGCGAGFNPGIGGCGAGAGTEPGRGASATHHWGWPCALAQPHRPRTSQRSCKLA
jgi:hypothetical protein